MRSLEAKTLTAAVKSPTGEAGGNPLLRIDPGMVLWTWVVFFALLLLLRRFAWKPILNALKSREGRIEQSLQNADAIEKNLQQSKEKQEQILQEARREASQIVEQAKTSAEGVARSIQAKAQEEADALLKRTEAQVETQKQAAFKDLQGQSAGLALHIASKILDKNLNDETNRKFAEQALKEMGEAH